MKLESKKILTTNKGISLISLIITIIVIIILAAIVIFSGLGTPDSANLAKFTSEFADFNLAVDNAYMKEVEKNALANESRSKKQVYYEIATGIDVVETNAGNVNQVPTATGTVSALEALVGKIYPETLEGEDYYLITKDTNVYNWKKQKQYFEETEVHYLTDEGEAFFLPGYLVQEDDGSQKWFINESKYYYGPKQTGEGGVVTPPAGGGNQGSVTEYTDPSGEGKVKVLTDSEIGENSFLKDTTKIEMVLKAEDESTMVPVPKGFSYVLGTGDSGLVVKDGTGNEFVWIPVNVTDEDKAAYPTRNSIEEMYGEEEGVTYTLAGSTGVTTTKYGKGVLNSMTTPGSTGSSDYREPDLVVGSGGISYDAGTYTTTGGTTKNYYELAGFGSLEAFAQDLVNEFNAMIESVKNYGGFYVGRYELGLEGSTVVCKPNRLVLTAKAANGSDSYGEYGGTADTQRWYGLYNACKTFDGESVKSGMIWGSQWDVMVNFIGNHTSALPKDEDGNPIRYKTGENPNEDDEYKHVHDTSSNVRDWTATASNTSGRAPRGGSYSSADSASYRTSSSPNDTRALYGSRPQLYIQ